MIADNIKNAKLYYSLGSRISTGLKYLENTNFDEIPAGKYPIDGNNIFALVNEYSTKTVESTKPENHRKYIDIQYIVKGKEIMGYTFFNDQNPSSEYSTENDVTFYKCETSPIVFEEGSIAIFFPDDIHAPGIMIGAPSEVKKIVLKIKIDSL